MCKELEHLSRVWVRCQVWDVVRSKVSDKYKYKKLLHSSVFTNGNFFDDIDYIDITPSPYFGNGRDPFIGMDLPRTAANSFSVM